MYTKTSRCQRNVNQRIQATERERGRMATEQRHALLIPEKCKHFDRKWMNDMHAPDLATLRHWLHTAHMTIFIWWVLNNEWHTLDEQKICENHSMIDFFFLLEFFSSLVLTFFFLSYSVFCAYSTYEFTWNIPMEIWKEKPS